MIVVSNTSPISNLAVIGRLSLLRSLYKTVFIPEAVWNELSNLEHKSALENIVEASRDGWMKRRKVKEQNLLRILIDDLDCGEAEAIALAIQQNANLLLLDEAEGRRVASSAGLLVKGAAGVLARAAELSIIPDLQTDLGRLRNEAGFFLATDVEDFLVREVQKRIRRRRKN
jgi:uncharacterized protein